MEILPTLFTGKFMVAQAGTARPEGLTEMNRQGRGLNGLLLRLSKEGHRPAVYCRGKGTWRAHLNMDPNDWTEARSPHRALNHALKAWVNRMAMENHHKKSTAGSTEVDNGQQ